MGKRTFKEQGGWVLGKQVAAVQKESLFKVHADWRWTFHLVGLVKCSVEVGAGSNSQGRSVLDSGMGFFTFGLVGKGANKF